MTFGRIMQVQLQSVVTSAMQLQVVVGMFSTRRVSVGLRRSVAVITLPVEMEVYLLRVQ